MGAISIGYGNAGVPYPTLSLLLSGVGGCFGLAGLVFLIASCVKCCCLGDRTVVVDTRGQVVGYEVGGAPVQGDVDVEIEIGSDANLVGTMDVEMPKADIELEVEVEAPLSKSKSRPQLSKSRSKPQKS